jgi:hypothetical protein
MFTRPRFGPIIGGNRFDARVLGYRHIGMAHDRLGHFVRYSQTMQITRQPTAKSVPSAPHRHGWIALVVVIDTSVFRFRFVQCRKRLSTGVICRTRTLFKLSGVPSPDAKIGPDSGLPFLSRYCVSPTANLDTTGIGAAEALVLGLSSTPSTMLCSTHGDPS